jgi:Mg2+-importing ATPase
VSWRSWLVTAPAHASPEWATENPMDAAVASSHRRAPEKADTAALIALSQLSPEPACQKLATDLAGLTRSEAARRLKAYGPNLVTREQKPTILQEIWARARNPLNGLLLALAAVSYFLGDLRAAFVIVIMVVLSVVTAFVQEHRSNEAAARLRAMVKTTASVRRGPGTGALEFAEVPIETLVPGDIVRLSAGDMIPADLRLLEAKDLFVNQSPLTGEAMPIEKSAHACDGRFDDPFDLPNICFMGANVVSGYATGVIVRTGVQTFFGQLADEIAGRRIPTAFDQGINRFTLLMIRFIAVMGPLVFLINGLTKHDWLEALLFAVAVAVGLTPEMLPMIVTVNLAKGATAMARAKVIVKRLNAIQNLGAMDVLCTDKTGTLTQDRIILKRCLDIRGEDSERVLHYAYLNSHFQSGLKNLLDVAVLEHVDLHKILGIDSGYKKSGRADGRCHARRSRRSHHGVRKTHARPEGKDRAGAAPPGPCRRLPGRRDQRQSGAQGRRRRRFGRYRGRHRQGIGRHHPSREEPPGHARGRDRGPKDLR